MNQNLELALSYIAEIRADIRHGSRYWQHPRLMAAITRLDVLEGIVENVKREVVDLQDTAIYLEDTLRYSLRREVS